MTLHETARAVPQQALFIGEQDLQDVPQMVLWRWRNPPSMVITVPLM
jgi:hypothetical protein